MAMHTSLFLERCNSTGHSEEVRALLGSENGLSTTEGNGTTPSPKLTRQQTSSGSSSGSGAGHSKEPTGSPSSSVRAVFTRTRTPSPASTSRSWHVAEALTVSRRVSRATIPTVEQCRDHPRKHSEVPIYAGIPTDDAHRKSSYATTLVGSRNPSIQKQHCKKCSKAAVPMPTGCDQCGKIAVASREREFEEMKEMMKTQQAAALILMCELRTDMRYVEEAHRRLSAMIRRLDEEKEETRREEMARRWRKEREIREEGVMQTNREGYVGGDWRLWVGDNMLMPMGFAGIV